MRNLFFLIAAAPLLAQNLLGLRDAVRLALKQNKAIESAAANVAAAGSRVTEAKAGLLPKVNYSESWAASDNPVFVFGSLLTQHQFGPENFNIGTLNRPDALNNFQSQVIVDQLLYDAGRTKSGVKAAEIGGKLNTESRRRAEIDVIAGVVRAYYGALLAGENVKAAEEALRSARADLQRAESVRDAGMSTDVDVLSIRVHLAAVEERRISRAAELDVAKAALNDAIGLPLDTSFTLSTTLSAMDLPDLSVEALEREAIQARPEARQTRLAASLAQVQTESARKAMLPEVSFRGVFEADRQRFVTRGGANWLASIALRWNLFNGMADKARIAEASQMLTRAQADQQRTDSAVRLEVRRAFAGLRSAQQRIEVSKAAVTEAEESLRITQNRYHAGMSNVTDLIRNEVAVLESRTRYLAAIHDQRVAAAMLEYAAGKLTPESEVLN